MDQIYTSLKEIWGELKKKNAFTVSASVSFFTFLSIFPFFLLIISVSGLFIKKTQTIAKLEEYLQIFPKGISENFIQTLRGMIESSELITGISFLFLIFTSFNAFNQLQKGLNTILGTKQIKKGWKSTLTAFSFFLITAFFLLVIVLSGETLFVAARKMEKIPIVKSYYIILPLYILIEIVFFSFSYRYLSNKKISFRHVLVGGVVMTCLWEITKHIFGWYVSTINMYSAIYGSISSLILLQLWLFYSIFLYFFGAEVSIYLSRKSPNI